MQNSKPDVAPPASYKGPSFPTLAALGMLAATTALTAGCEHEKSREISTDSAMLMPVELCAFDNVEEQKPSFLRPAFVGGDMAPLELPYPVTPAEPFQLIPKEERLDDDYLIRGRLRSPTP